MSDIYKPKHYTNNEIEAIEFIEQTVKHYPSEQAYLIGNVIKYLARANHKGTKESDLLKAENYLHRAIKGVWKE